MRTQSMLAASLSLVIVGCMQPTPEVGTLQQAASLGDNDNGTRLRASEPLVVIHCGGNGQAQVDLSGTLTSTGSVDSADITYSINGGGAVPAGVINPQDFVHSGRTKTAPYNVTLTLPDGIYSVEICFTQSGAQGRLPKQDCTTVAFQVNCNGGENPECRHQGFFGDVVHNPVLCNGGSNNVPVHLKAIAVGDVELTISGPNGFQLVVIMRHAGESCVYQYNWATRKGNGGAGNYTFTAVDLGNGNVLDTVTAPVSCIP